MLRFSTLKVIFVRNLDFQYVHILEIFIIEFYRLINAQNILLFLRYLFINFSLFPIHVDNISSQNYFFRLVPLAISIGLLVSIIQKIFSLTNMWEPLTPKIALDN